MKYAVAQFGILSFVAGGALLGVRYPGFSSRVSYESTDATSTLAVLASREEERKATLLFGGDVMFARGIEQVMRSRDDYRYHFREIQNIITSADLAIVNLESPISSRGQNIGSKYSFRADPQSINSLVFAGIDVVTLANNHAGDYGQEALTDTLKILSGVGISATGAGATMEQVRMPLIMEANKLKVAFLGATSLSPAWLTRADSAPAVASLDERSIIEGITVALAQGADLVIILLHWGNEYETKHNKAQETLAHKLIDAGATMVIGHHPHVVQEVERYKNGLIAYSLGNFIFDQNFSTDTHHGLLLKVTVNKDSILNVSEIPIYFGEGYRPSAMLNTTNHY